MQKMFRHLAYCANAAVLFQFSCGLLELRATGGELKQIIVYSHDTYGLGNIRRMLSLCEHLISASSDCSILLLTGSPLVHAFRLPQRLDYIKLPCLSRTNRDTYRASHLVADTEVTIRLRSRLILSAI